VTGISVIIPTYNRATILTQAIDSVCRQSLLPDEIIVVDDGSTDGTLEVLKKAYPDVVVVHQDNGGVSRARNKGLELASHEWIALLDSDDQWLPGKLATQVRYLERNPHIRVCHTDELWIRHGKRVNPMKKHSKPEGWIYRDCLPLCCVSPSSVVIHRSVFERAGVFDESFPACEDYELWLRIFVEFEAGLVNEPQLKKYGGHEDQLSKKFWGMDRFRVRAMEKIVQSGLHGPRERGWTIDMLTEKCAILENGFRKRGKNPEANKYRAIAARYLEEFPSC